jgi:hypothetical protein
MIRSAVGGSIRGNREGALSMLNSIGNQRAYHGYPPPQFPREAPNDSPAQRTRFGGGRGVAALLLVLVLVAVGVIAVSAVTMVTRGDAQMATVRQFCASQGRQDYAAAYNQLAPAYVQAHELDPARYTDRMTQRDQTDGPVRSCVITGRDYPQTFASALFLERGFVFQIKVTRGGGSQAGTITMVDDHGWKVRYLDNNLHLDQ